MTPPHDDDKPALPPDTPEAFAAPWHAQVFSLAVKLHQNGHFTWAEWTERFAAELALPHDEAAERPPDDTHDHYYDCWLRTLEKLVAEKNLLSDSALDARRKAWIEAARRTPHGQPIVLADDN